MLAFTYALYVNMRRGSAESMAGQYRTLFQEPGTKPLTAAGLVARMPLSMVGIGVITMVSSTTGSYALAGALAASYAVSAAIAGPQVARFVDRFGQRRVIPFVAAFSAVAIALLALTSASGGPEWLLFTTAILAGIAPSAPALVRARWTHLLRGTPRLHAAYAWETVLDEASFILGPPLSIGLSVALFPQAGPLVAGAFLLVGVLWLAGQRHTEPPVRAALQSSRRSSALREPTVALVAVVMVALGAIIGTIDVVSVAFAEQEGAPVAASIVLSVYAISSCAAGFLFGSREWKTPTPRLLRLGLLATAVTVLPLLWVPTIAALCVAVFVSGIFFAPTMIMAAKLIEEVVPEDALTESLTWSTAGLGFGTALGPAIAGSIIDAHGATDGFWVAIVAAALLAGLSLAVADARQGT